MYRMWTGLVALAGFAFNFAFLGRKSLGIDEMFSLQIARDWHFLWQMARTQEINMWLYYVVLNFWLKFGQSETWVRSLSALFATLTVPMFYLTAKEILGERTAKIATPLLLLNFFFVFYAQVARSYSLVLALMTAATYFFWKSLNKGGLSNWLGLVLLDVLAVYSHLFAGLAIAVQFIIFVFYLNGRGKWKKIFISGAVIAFCLLPLLTSPSFGGHTQDWVGKPGLKSLGAAYLTLAGDSVLAAIIYLGLIGKLLMGRLKKLDVKVTWLGLWLVLPISFAFLFSLFVKPIYTSVYFNISLIPFILLGAWSLAELKRGVLFKVLLGAMLVVSGLRLGAWYLEDQRFHWVIDNKNEDWRGAASYVSANLQADDGVVFYAYFIRPVFEYYLGRPANLLEISSGSYWLGGGAKLPEPNFEMIRTMPKTYNRVWLVLAHKNEDYLDRRKQAEEVESALGQSYSLEKEAKFEQVEVRLYSK